MWRQRKQERGIRSMGVSIFKRWSEWIIVKNTKEVRKQASGLPAGKMFLVCPRRPM